MGLQVGDIISVTYKAEYAGQQIRNILHYRCTSSGTSSTPEGDLANVADDFAAPLTNSLTAAFQNCAVDAMGWTGIQAQRVYPTRTILMEEVSSWPGSIVADGLPPNVAAVLTKRTTIPGRPGVGSLHVTAVPVNLVTAGVINDLTNFQGLAAEVVGARVVSASTLSIEPVIFNPTTPPNFYGRLFDVIAQDTIRVMRRRTVRVGI